MELEPGFHQGSQKKQNSAQPCKAFCCRKRSAGPQPEDCKRFTYSSDPNSGTSNTYPWCEHPNSSTKSTSLCFMPANLQIRALYFCVIFVQRTGKFMPQKYCESIKVHKRLDFIILVYAAEELFILKLYSQYV